MGQAMPAGPAGKLRWADPGQQLSRFLEPLAHEHDRLVQDLSVYALPQVAHGSAPAARIHTVQHGDGVGDFVPSDGLVARAGLGVWHLRLAARAWCGGQSELPGIAPAPSGQPADDRAWS